MFRRRQWVISVVFIVSDILLIYTIFHLSIWLRNVLLGPKTVAIIEDLMPMIQLGILFCVGVFFANGLYPGYGLTAVKELEQMENAIALAFFLLATVLYLNKPYQVFSRFVLFETWVLCAIFLPLAHLLLRSLMSGWPWYGVPVIVFGAGEWASQVESSIRNIRRLGWKVQAVLPSVKHKELDESNIKAKIAILIPSAQEDFEISARSLSQIFKRVILIWQKPSFGSQWVEPRDLDGWLGLEFSYHLLARRNRWIKQGMDILGSALLLIALAPALALISLLVALDSVGPVIYHQQRMGKDRRKITILKFRTMVVDAEAQLAQILDADPLAREEYKTFHKLKNDPRITRVGSWLRRFSLDELPQIINVLRGEMSLVGPRAYMTSELDDIGEYVPIILRVKPGMTGWWQVIGRHTTSFQERLMMDEYYISNWSIWMDIYVLLKTLRVIMIGTGV